MRRFIGSPPPTALKGRDLSSSTEVLVGLSEAGKSQSQEVEDNCSEDESEEQMVYDPEISDIDNSQPKIMLQPAPKAATPPHHQQILAASISSVSLHSLVSNSSFTNELTPPPKFLTYQGSRSAEAVQVKYVIFLYFTDKNIIKPSDFSLLVDNYILLPFIYNYS